MRSDGIQYVQCASALVSFSHFKIVCFTFSFVWPASERFEIKWNWNATLSFSFPISVLTFRSTSYFRSMNRNEFHRYSWIRCKFVCQEAIAYSHFLLILKRLYFRLSRRFSFVSFYFLFCVVYIPFQLLLFVCLGMCNFIVGSHFTVSSFSSFLSSKSLLTQWTHTRTWARYLMTTDHHKTSGSEARRRKIKQWDQPASVHRTVCLW